MGPSMDFMHGSVVHSFSKVLNPSLGASIQRDGPNGVINRGHSRRRVGAPRPRLLKRQDLQRGTAHEILW